MTTIAVCIASRMRPAALIGAVMAAQRLSTGRNKVQFVLGVDDDDERTFKHLAALVGELVPAIVTVSDVRVRGQVENAMLAEVSDMDVDIATLMSDRAFVVTPGWDDGLIAASAAAPKRVLWWSCPEDNGCVMPIIPATYLRAIDYRWSAEVHPFWWDDTYQQEIDLLLHGMPSMKVRPAYSGQRGATQSARDFTFWLDVFTAMRDRRRTEARRIAATLELPWQERPEVERYFQAYDNAMRARCETFEQQYGDKNPPSERYLAARARAEAILQGTT